MGLYPKEVLEYIAFSGIPRGPKSKVFCVDPVHGSDTNSGDRWTQPLATVSAAYALTTTLHHDVVLVIGSTTAITETAQVAWSNSLTHLIGIGAPTQAGKRTRIISGTDDLSPFWNITGSGCVFKNVRIVHEQAADTGSLINVQLGTGGIRNYFENVEFHGNATESSALDTGCSLKLAGTNGGTECLFRDCVIGNDTVLSATGLMAMVMAGSNYPTPRFEHCQFRAYAGSTAAGFVEVMSNTAIGRAVVFEDCEFFNLNTDFTIASAFVIGAGMDIRYKRIFLKNCAGFGFTDWENANTSTVWLNNGTFTAGTHAGLFQASAT